MIYTAEYSSDCSTSLGCLELNGEMNTVCERVKTSELKLEMFVTDLDRPWLGAPFSLQGFLSESAREIEPPTASMRPNYSLRDDDAA